MASYGMWSSLCAVISGTVLLVCFFLMIAVENNIFIRPILLLAATVASVASVAVSGASIYKSRAYSQTILPGVVIAGLSLSLNVFVIFCIAVAPGRGKFC